MKKIFFVILCTVPFCSLFLHAPAEDPFENLFLENEKDAHIKEIKRELELTENDQLDEQTVQNLLKRRFRTLVHYVKRQKEVEKYQDEDMKNFLIVAMASKNGVPDESYKDIRLASSLFTIVYNNTKSDALRAIARRSRGI